MFSKKDPQPGYLTGIPTASVGSGEVGGHSKRSDREKNADLQLAKKLREAASPDGTLAVSITAAEALRAAQLIEETINA